MRCEFLRIKKRGEILKSCPIKLVEGNTLFKKKKNWFSSTLLHKMTGKIMLQNIFKCNFELLKHRSRRSQIGGQNESLFEF